MKDTSGNVPDGKGMLFARITFDPTRGHVGLAVRRPETLHAIVAGITEGSARPLHRVEGNRLYVVAPTVDGEQAKRRLSSPRVEVTGYGPFLDGLAKGQQWRFTINANPTTGVRGVHRPITDPARAVAWLESRLARNGATARDTRIRSWRTLRFRKRDSDGVTLHTADMTGILTVEDPDALRRALTGGIGRGKAYGAGLLLLTPTH